MFLIRHEQTGEFCEKKLFVEHPEKEKILKRIRDTKSKGVPLTERDEMILWFEEKTTDDVVEEEIQLTHIRNDPDDSIVLTAKDWVQDRHQPRSMKIYLNPYDRVFWVNLLIACEGREAGEQNAYSKSSSKLANTLNDLDAFIEFYTPPLFGDPWLVYKEKMRSAGFFSFTKRLENPTFEELEIAIVEIREWIDVNVSDPEFNSVQFNLCFSGHGDFDENNGASIQLRDDDVYADEIAELIHEAIPSIRDCENRHRLDMYLDCCHAGAVALETYKHILKINNKKLLEGEAKAFDDGLALGGVGPGRIFCSSMHDELSYENDDVGHGYFTYAFLNEFSSKPVIKGDSPNIALRDIGWYSDCRQHPFFISFLRDSHPDNEDFLIKFPSMVHLQNSLLNRPAKLPCFRHTKIKLLRFWSKLLGVVMPKKIIYVKFDGTAIDNIYSGLEFRRRITEQVESSLLIAPELRQIYERGEYFQAEIHWF